MSQIKINYAGKMMTGRLLQELKDPEIIIDGRTSENYIGVEFRQDQSVVRALFIFVRYVDNQTYYRAVATGKEMLRVTKDIKRAVNTVGGFTLPRVIVELTDG